MRFFWFILGIISLVLGFLGVFLPLLPTVPFILLAAFCFARSSNKLHHWLVNHKTFGPMISDWNEKGAISNSAKKMATLSIAIVFSISIIMGLAIHILLIQALTLSCVMIFIWSRPTP